MRRHSHNAANSDEREEENRATWSVATGWPLSQCNAQLLHRRLQCQQFPVVHEAVLDQAHGLSTPLVVCASDRVPHPHLCICRGLKVDVACARDHFCFELYDRLAEVLVWLRVNPASLLALLLSRECVTNPCRYRGAKEASINKTAFIADTAATKELRRDWDRYRHPYVRVGARANHRPSRHNAGTHGHLCLLDVIR